MFKYKLDVLQALKIAGYNTTVLRAGKLLSESAIQDIRKQKVIGIKSLEKICELLNMQPGDIIQYIPEEKIGEDEQKSL